MGLSSLTLILIAAVLLPVPDARSQQAQEGDDSENIHRKKLVCYYTNWSQYRPKIGKFFPEDIDPYLCTHVIFAFGWMKKNKLAAFDASDEGEGDKKGMFDRVVDLKTKNPNLKVLLAVGGWSFGTQRFKDMSASQYSRHQFIFSSIEFLREREFDGLDIDWEYPRGPDDKKNFVILLQEMKEAFEEEARDTQLPRLLITAAVSAGMEAVRLGYDVTSIAEHVDFINIMSYDFHGKWENRTGHNSPLYPPANETSWRKQLCMDFAVRMWERLGTPKEKIVVGMATYGRSFTLVDPTVHGIDAPAKGGGVEGIYTRESGFVAYYEVCEFLKNGAKYIWDEHQMVPYVHKGDQWIGFDDARSIKLKIRWLLDHDYAGAMVWTVDMDDFGATCSPKSFPLIGTIKEEFDRHFAESIAANVISTKPPRRKSSRVPLSVASSPKGSPVAEPSIEKQVVVPDPETNARVVCYYTNWSQRRPGPGKFVPEYMDPYLCTHLIFAFAGIKDQKISPTSDLDESEGSRKGLYHRILNLKTKNPDLKVLLAVGGWMVGPEPFKEVTETNYRKMSFILNVIDFLRDRGFDGLDVDWEFPRGEDDKSRFTELVKDFRTAFDGEAKTSQKPRLILSVAVPASFEAIDSGYDVAEIDKYVDMLNILTYDYHGDWERNVGHNSPLFALQSSSPYQMKLTVDYSVSEWLRKGANKLKIQVGLPTYGRTFTLRNISSNDIAAPAKSGGKPGRFTRESGFLAFYEVCEFLKNDSTLVWDHEQMVPYAYKGDQWIGFDDKRSFVVKTQWMKEIGLGGVMIWAVDMDDFRGNCMGKTFPLIKAVKEELRGYAVPNLDTQSSNVEKAVDALNDEIFCEEEDGHISYHPDMNDCTMYYMCEGKRRHHMPCPVNLVFNPDGDVCDWPENVDDCYSAR